jgi:aldehyde:ferredoxin oxidoreductase
VVRGKADRPVYLNIHDGKVEIKDAAHLRGKTGFDAIDMLKEELGKDVGVLAVGPAGENLVRFSTVIAEEGAIGSGGIGAVMGSKNVKAFCYAAIKNQWRRQPEDGEHHRNARV